MPLDQDQINAHNAQSANDEMRRNQERRKNETLLERIDRIEKEISEIKLMCQQIMKILLPMQAKPPKHGGDDYKGSVIENEKGIKQ